MKPGSGRSTPNEPGGPPRRSWVVYYGRPVACLVAGLILLVLGQRIVGLILLVVAIFLTSFAAGADRLADALARRIAPEAFAGEDREDGVQYPEALAVLDEFDEFIRYARTVPLRDQVRLNPGRVDALLDRLRTALNRGPFELVGLLDELDELVRRAKPIRLTNEIRINRSEIYDLLDRLRADCATPART